MLQTAIPHALLVISVLFAAVVEAAPSQTAAQSETALAIDVGPEGAGDRAPEIIEDCLSVAVGDRFDIDMVVKDVSDLLAWEAPLEFDPEVVIVTDQNVKLFQAVNVGSSVIDLSAQLPDDSGFHMLSAFESSDPPDGDSGSGVLARITLEAVGAGESELRFGTRDLDFNGEPDRGVLLRNLDNEAIGDQNDDTLFDGDRADALVVVGSGCPDDRKVYVPQSTSASDGGSLPWAYVGVGVAAACIALGGIAAAILVPRRRPSSASGEATEPQP